MYAVSLPMRIFIVLVSVFGLLLFPALLFCGMFIFETAPVAATTPSNFKKSLRETFLLDILSFFPGHYAQLDFCDIIPTYIILREGIVYD